MAAAFGLQAADLTPWWRWANPVPRHHEELPDPTYQRTAPRTGMEMSAGGAIAGVVARTIRR
ncbi:hypothetical protein OG780_42610 [Streptomyces sp. NBC_00386]|uniref:hypothetical protein n=1 Tax=Streptomyces sp. NBC_00386 TaxID=2975734 RepID=UPI002E245C88